MLISIVMKIAIFTQGFPPNRGGVSNVITHNIRAIKKLKKDITFEIFTSIPKGPDTFEGFKVNRFNPKKITVGPKNYRIYPKMIKSVKDCDLVHSHHYGYFPAVAGFLSAKLSKRPFVFTPHYHPPVYGTFRKILFGAYHFVHGIPLLRSSKRTMPITNYEKSRLLKIGAKEKNMKVIPNSLDTDLFKPKEKTKENLVLFVSSMKKEKGPHHFFNISQKILNKRKDIKFVMIGSGPLKEKIVKKAKKTHPDNYKFLENLDLEELIKWYSKAKVKVLPSYYEAFGMVLAEPMACKTPVISTKVGGVPEVVKNGKTGYVVDYGEWDEMKEKILKIVDMNKNKYEVMCKKARKHVVKNFDYMKVGKQLLNVYKSVLEDKK